MRKPHRRGHVLIWLALLPIVLAGFFFALQQRAPAPFTDEATLESLTGGAQ